MRNFLNSHWKVIIAILLAIGLAVLTVETKSEGPPLAARLQAHVRALAPDAPHDAMRHVAVSLMRSGYAPRAWNGAAGGAGAARGLEVSVANLAPGAAPQQLFIVGARLGPGGNPGAAAVLELARAGKDLRPALGTEVRFVFFDSAAPPRRQAGPALADPAAGTSANFMAFIGSRAAAATVRQALAAFRSDPTMARQGLAAPAHVMGVTLYGRGAVLGNGPALVITDTGFLRYPYFRANENGDELDELDYESMAHVVDGLAQTLAALAGAVET